MRQLREQFRATDPDGCEYEVRVYVDASAGAIYSGRSWTVDGAATGQATALSGPRRGQQFDASWNPAVGFHVRAAGTTIPITRTR
jgi:hypothetical protein